MQRLQLIFSKVFMIEIGLPCRTTLTFIIFLTSPELIRSHLPLFLERSGKIPNKAV